jgi:hypothetical protein
MSVLVILNLFRDHKFLRVMVIIRIGVSKLQIQFSELRSINIECVGDGLPNWQIHSSYRGIRRPILKLLYAE